MHRRQVMTGAAITGTGLVASGLVAAVQASGEAGVEAIVERFAATLTAHDITAFGALFADDDVNHQVSAAAPPTPGKPAKQATIDLFAARLTGLPDLRVDVEVTIASSDRAAELPLYRHPQWALPRRRPDRTPPALHLLRHLHGPPGLDRRALGHGRHRRHPGRAAPLRPAPHFLTCPLPRSDAARGPTAMGFPSTSRAIDRRPTQTAPITSPLNP